MNTNDDKRNRALVELLDACVEADPCVEAEQDFTPDVAGRFKRVREAAHAFVEADRAAIIAESTFVAPPERAQ